MSKCLSRGVEFIWLSPGPLKLTNGLISAHNYDGFMLRESFVGCSNGRKEISMIGNKFATNLTLQTCINPV